MIQCRVSLSSCEKLGKFYCDTCYAFFDDRDHPPCRVNDGYDKKIKLKHWSATDYAYLVNNSLGWISDDEKYYCFDNKEEMQKFQDYLNLPPKEQAKVVKKQLEEFLNKKRGST